MHIYKPAEEKSLGYILSRFLETIAQDLRTEALPSVLEALVAINDNIILNKPLPPIVHCFALDDDSTNSIVNILKEQLASHSAVDMKRLNSPITYMLDELICNIQQHAQTEKGYAYTGYDKETNTIEIVIADSGITIYGSYVFTQKYLEHIGNSDAAALNLARNGYSTKNLPNSENRGYGISSNIQMIVNGLHGEVAVLSGNALLAHFKDKKKILSLPNEIDFKGTIIIIRIPSTAPADFDLYKYMY